MNIRIYLPLIFFFCLILTKFIQDSPPDKNNSFVFYSNQSQVDLKKNLITALDKAQKSIYISVYALTDSKIISTLNKRANNRLPVRVLIDKKQSKSLAKKLSSNIEIITIKQKGLMHQKLFLIDDTVYLGSANLTTSSLRMHDNLMIGHYNPLFTSYLKRELFDLSATKEPFLTAEIEFYNLPSFVALERILSLINGAKKSIRIAMFTFTHPDVLIALSKAHKKGVKVEVVFDYLSHKGASKKMAEGLKKAGILLAHNRGLQLMHHKFALVDDNILVMGSTNWTKSAFEKNHDDLLILPCLKKRDQKFMKALWRNLWWESKIIRD